MCKDFEIEDFENLENLSQDRLIKLWHRVKQYKYQLADEIKGLDSRIAEIEELINSID